MQLAYCPRCNQRYARMEHTGDFEHTCNSGNNTLDQEDKKVIGSWQDYTGSESLTIGDVYAKALGVKNQGQRSEIEGTRIPDYTRRGNNADITRQRQHIESIEHRD